MYKLHYDNFLINEHDDNASYNATGDISLSTNNNKTLAPIERYPTNWCTYADNLVITTCVDIIIAIKGHQHLLQM